MNTSSLLLSLLFSSIGLGYFTYGKRQQRFGSMLAGAGLCVYTYFVSGVLLTVGIGVAFMALPFFISF
ncbi:MAG: amino acid transport protein [Gammaproteobacteria bacterium]